MRTSIWYECEECLDEIKVSVNIEHAEIVPHECPKCQAGIDLDTCLENASEKLQDEKEAAAEDAADAKREEEE